MMSLVLLPQTSLFLGTLALLMVGVFTKQKTAFTITSILSIALLVIVYLLSHAGVNTSALPAFVTNAFDFGKYTLYFSDLILAASGVTILAHLLFACSSGQEKGVGIRQFEYNALVLLSTLGMILLISAKTLMGIYVSLELQSLALYVLIAMNRDDVPAIEASVKYFVTGALSTGFLLLGLSFLFGASGSLDLTAIADLIRHDMTNPFLLLGLGLTLVGFLFKVSMAPFHMWTPDVYQGSPTPVTLFMATAAKAATLGIIIKLIVTLCVPAEGALDNLIVALSLFTMVAGTLGALGQTNLKRLFAFSGVGHVGFILLPLAGLTLHLQGETGTAYNASSAVSASLLYVTVYILTAVGSFVALLSLKTTDNKSVETLDHLKGLSEKSPFVAFCLSVLVLSMAGIPPLAGFFAKFSSIQQAIAAGHIVPAVVAVLVSVVSCSYYLKVIRVMYFDEPVCEVRETSFGLRVILAVVVGVLLFFMLAMPSLTPVIEKAGLGLLS